MALDNARKEKVKERRKTIALDFDGVLHKYSKKWHDGTIYDPPVDGAVMAVRELAKNYNLVIFTCREPLTDIYRWVIDVFGFPIEVTCYKPHADMYIDDRGYHFDGDWDDALDEIDKRAKKGFQPDGFRR